MFRYTFINIFSKCKWKSCISVLQRTNSVFSNKSLSSNGYSGSNNLAVNIGILYVSSKYLISI